VCKEGGGRVKINGQRTAKRVRKERQLKSLSFLMKIFREF
jgi:hypothetical protein